LSVAASALRSLSSNKANGLPQWISGSAALQGRLGSPETTAQVNPADFTRAMAELATDLGAQTIIGEVDGIDLGPTGDKVSAVCINGEPLACDSAVIAMGPWSNLAREWLPLPPVYGWKGNSIVFRTTGNIAAHALFADVETGDGELLSPEVYPRPDGTIYVCGLSSQQALPADPESVVADRERIQRLRAAAIAIAPCLAEAAVIAEQACFRPVSRDGLPLIGRVEDVEGAFIATGHSVWGILNAPATGEAMAQLILNGGSDIDLSPFHPGRMN
jgi:glycine/D-amino acid oxidase-like deaminating enzyme